MKKYMYLVNIVVVVRIQVGSTTFTKGDGEIFLTCSAGREPGFY